MSDTQDDDAKKGKNPPPSNKVVVTYSANPQKTGDIPAEILPSTPAKVVSNPIDSGVNPAKEFIHKPSTQSKKGRLHAQIPDEIAPRVAQPQSHAKPQEDAVEEPSMGYHEAPPPVPPHQTPPPPPPSPPSAGNATSSMALFLSLMTMIAVVALVFYTYYSQKNISALQSQSRDEQVSVQVLLSKAKQSLAQVETLQQEGQAQQKAFHELKTDLQNAQMRLVTLSGSKNWVISEVNYLIFMANERLRVAHDIPTAITQLQAAQEKVTMLGDPALWGLKEALAKDIAVLSTLPRVNKQGLWEQLNILKPLIEKLPFKTLNNQTNGIHETKSEAVDESLPAWRKGLWRSWQELKSLIRITKEVDNPIPQALSFQEKAEIVRTMQLMLDQAQWAVLEGNSKIYLSSLDSLQKWMQNYFANSPEQQTIIALLMQLKTQSVDSPLADISTTLKALSNMR
ncbi:uroporphyrinogen-III C-methyltransferase [Candidatus Berkiella aquae]|uniref:Uroporphyrinogen-III C-methyltransferase n=1 Tax=Candidatus Berkiella aquae TaxID=295108 RepID=A0A0Q9YYM1_9GAMM|nr:uroporphyrinogen-III C-methyltransferase [Candidatus Berkiella aquae]MCS5712697.1 uroporphyrinogen-III C-methyltransferase [Candidatus Berkiella aquae]